MPHCGGEGQTREKHRNIAVFSLVMPGSVAGLSLQRPAGAQAASFGATLRAQGRHRKPALKEGVGYREVFLHKKCQPVVASALNTSLSCLTSHNFSQRWQQCSPSQEGHQDGFDAIQKQIQFSDSQNIRPPITHPPKPSGHTKATQSSSLLKASPSAVT